MLSLPRASILLAAIASLSLSGACGGNVIVDATTVGAGGSGGAAQGSCDALLADLEQKVNAAAACDPYIDAVQCNGTAFVLDACGCQVLANETNPEAVGLAKTAHQAALNAVCLAPCAAPCPPFASGFCNTSTKVCTVALPD